MIVECVKCKKQRLIEMTNEICPCGYIGWETVNEVFYDICPDCGCKLKCNFGGGVSCENKRCDYWFCF